MPGAKCFAKDLDNPSWSLRWRALPLTHENYRMFRPCHDR